MIHYITSFIVYTLAMIGALVLGFVVYKKTMLANPIKRDSMLKIADMLRLPDRKTLYVINCKNEQFLIASSNDKVSLISKINSGKEDVEKYLKEKNTQTGKSEEDAAENQIIKNLLKELSDKNKTKRGNY